MERAIEIYAIVNCAVVGLSHALAPGAWTVFFAHVRERGVTGVLAIAMLHLAFGSLIVAFHNVWSGLAVALTIYGWANVLKALIYSTVPGFALRKMRVASNRDFVLAGVLMLAFAALLTYHVATTAA